MVIHAVPPVFWMILGLGLAPLLFVQAFKWLFVPLMIRRTQTSPLQITRVPTQVEQLTPELQGYLGDTVRQFVAEGFSVAANVFSPGAAAGMDAITLLFVRPDTGDTARTFAVTAKASRVMTALCLTELPDGRRWATTSSNQPAIFPAQPDVFVVTCSWVTAIGPLYEFHRRRLKDAGVADVIGVTPREGEELEFLQRDEDRENAWLIRRGYRAIDTKAGVRRFTIKGAYLCVWKMLNPIKWWRVRARDRFAMREWRRLGMGEPVIAPQADVQIVENTDADAADFPADGAVLAYTAEPPPGESRIAEHNGVTTVRIAPSTPALFFKRNLLSFLWFALMAFFVSRILYHVWQIRQIFYVPYSVLLGASFWVLALFSVASVVQLANRWLRHRRAVTLRASHDGLAFAGIVSTPRRGTIARSEVANLAGIFGSIGIGGRTYKLILQRRGRTLPIVLAQGRSKAEVEEMAVRLKVAMGIANSPDAIPA